MIWPEAFLAFILALFFLFLFAAMAGVGWWGRESSGWRAAPWVVFIVLFLGIWAAGVWVEPVGPVVYGVAWVPFLLFAFFIALIIAAVAGARPRWSMRTDTTRGTNRAVSRPADTRGDAPAEPVDAADPVDTAAAGVGIFLWLLFLGLFAVIILAYL